AERETARQKEAEANDQRERALRDRQRARNSVRDFLVSAKGSKELKTPGFERFRQELLVAALRYYDEFTFEEDDNPRLPSEIAHVTLTVTQLARKQNSFAEAVEWGKKAVARYEAILEKDPQNEDMQQYLGWALEELGMAYEACGKDRSRDEAY